MVHAGPQPHCMPVVRQFPLPQQLMFALLQTGNCRRTRDSGRGGAVAATVATVAMRPSATAPRSQPAMYHISGTARRRRETILCQDGQVGVRDRLRCGRGLLKRVRYNNYNYRLNGVMCVRHQGSPTYSSVEIMAV